MKELQRLMNFYQLISKNISLKTTTRWLGQGPEWTGESDCVWRERNVQSKKHHQCPALKQKRPLPERDISIVRAMPMHSTSIHNFLYTNYWCKELSVLGLQISLDSDYLKHVTKTYATSGDRFLALERIDDKSIMIGFAVARKKYPWMINELKAWARGTASDPEKSKIYFNAFCLENPNLFDKYNVDYVYDVECISVAENVMGIGVDDWLLQSILENAKQSRLPLVQVVCGSYNTTELCERCGLKRAWTMNYEDFLDDWYRQIFYPRNHEISIYVKYFDPQKPICQEECLTQ